MPQGGQRGEWQAASSNAMVNGGIPMRLCVPYAFMRLYASVCVCMRALCVYASRLDASVSYAPVCVYIICAYMRPL
jgi:hypothetical protein